MNNVITVFRKSTNHRSREGGCVLLVFFDWQTLDKIELKAGDLDFIGEWWENEGGSSRWGEFVAPLDSGIIFVPREDEPGAGEGWIVFRVLADDRVELRVMLEINEHEFAEMFIVHLQTSTFDIVETGDKTACYNVLDGTFRKCHLRDTYPEGLPSLFLETKKWAGAVFMVVADYMANNRSYVECESETLSRRRRGGKRKKRKQGKRRITRKIYKVGNPSQKEARPYQRHVETWNVRGHWRNLKSGKRIWIKPHVKGDLDKIPEPVTYVV